MRVARMRRDAASGASIVERLKQIPIGQAEHEQKVIIRRIKVELRTFGS